MLNRKRVLKVSQIHEKTYVLKSLFNKAAGPWPATLLEEDYNASIFLRILQKI